MLRKTSGFVLQNVVFTINNPKQLCGLNSGNFLYTPKQILSYTHQVKE